MSYKYSCNDCKHWLDQHCYVNPPTVIHDGKSFVSVRPQTDSHEYCAYGELPKNDYRALRDSSD